MTRVLLSPLAQKDIADIWDYTAERWGIDQAEAYIRRIEAAVEAIAAAPEQGRACDDIRPGYRKLTAGSHVLFYRRISEAIDIVRILHRRMDFDRHL